MGGSRLIPWTIEMTVPGLVITPAEWYFRKNYWGRKDGAPTPANIEAHIVAFVNSQKPGGPNVALAGPYGPRIPTRAVVRNQKTGETFHWTAPKFWVI